MPYKVSIIISTYNNSKNFFKEIFESLKNQTLGFKNIEIIIVDNNSKDYTKNIIKKISLKYDNCRPIFTTEKSIFHGKAKNIGIDKATGDFITFINNPDVLSEKFCEKLYEIISTESVDIVFSNHVSTLDSSIDEDFSKTHNYKKFKIDSVDGEEFLMGLSPFFSEAIFRRDFLTINNLKFVENNILEDMCFIIESLLNAKSIVFLPKCEKEFIFHEKPYHNSLINISHAKCIHSFILGNFSLLGILKKYNKEVFFVDVMKNNLILIIDFMISGKVDNSEKISLLKFSTPLFEKLNENEFSHENEFYEFIITNITNFNYYDITTILDKIKVTNQLEKNTKILEKKIIQKKSQLKNLRAIHGWISYKTKNILSRVRKKF